MKIYLKNWIQCQLPTKAATNDLQMLKDLVNYKSVNERISKVAFEKLRSHTWYLGEVVVAFTFFNDDIDDSTKQRMVKNLKERKGRPGNILLPPVDEKGILTASIDDFVTQKTQYIFKMFYGERFMSTENFLYNNPSSWIDDAQYIAGKEFVENLLIVNDVAERYIALATSFNSSIVKSESQRKCLLQVVEDNRQRFPKGTGKKKYAQELNRKI